MTTAQNKAEAFIVPVEWKAAGDDANVLEGYASTFGNVDFQGDVIDPKAFNKTVEAVNSKGIPLLLEHNPRADSVLGTVFWAKPDKKGLKIKARISNAPSVQELKVKMQEGHVGKMSIGYYPVKWSYKRTGDGEEVRVLEEIKLREVSVVAFPANDQATITRVKNEVGTLSQEDRVNLALELVKALLAPAPGADSGAGVADEPATSEGAVKDAASASEDTPDEEHVDESRDGAAKAEEDEASAYVFEFLGIGPESKDEGDSSYLEALVDPDDLNLISEVEHTYAALKAALDKKEKK